MVIDLILDRRDNERSGIFNYEPGKFYRECMEYGEVADDICNYVDSVDWL